MQEGQTARRRLFFVDNLRTLLIIMVVVFHLAVTYGASGHWPYREGQPDDLTSLDRFCIHAGLFCLWLHPVRRRAICAGCEAELAAYVGRGACSAHSSSLSGASLV